MGPAIELIDNGIGAAGRVVRVIVQRGKEIMWTWEVLPEMVEIFTSGMLLDSKEATNIGYRGAPSKLQVKLSPGFEAIPGLAVLVPKTTETYTYAYA